MEHTPAWLVNSFIYLSAAVLAVPLSKALGLGSIIGYLAAGIAIGPWGIGLVANGEDILHFAEFGVVLMVGGSIPGETRTIAISIYDKVQGFDLASANQMALLLLVLSLLAVAASFFASARLGGKR